jgi:hypothetical protein
MNGSDEKSQKYERKVRRDRLWTFVSVAEFVVGFFLRRVRDMACELTITGIIFHTKFTSNI